MRPSQIEAWALRVIEAARRKQHVEDSRVELKAEWPHPRKAARRIAGHANAASEEPILWLIGLDERRGVVGVTESDFASWRASVDSFFDSIAPGMTEVAVATEEGTVIALLFDTSRPPYVVINPEGGEIQREVPWRDATGIRSAKRSELLRILAPLAPLPDAEPRYAELAVAPVGPAGESSKTLFYASLYLVPRSGERVVIPKHRCTLSVLNEGERDLGLYHIGIASQTPLMAGTDHEVIAYGPGAIELRAETSEDLSYLTMHEELEVRCRLTPVEFDRAITVDLRLGRVTPDGSRRERTVFKLGSR